MRTSLLFSIIASLMLTSLVSTSTRAGTYEGAT